MKFLYSILFLFVFSEYFITTSNGKAVEVNVTNAEQSDLFSALEAANLIPLTYDVVINIRLPSPSWISVDSGLPSIMRPMTLNGCDENFLGVSGIGIGGNGITISTAYTTNNTEQINIQCVNVRGFDVGIASDTFVKWAYINIQKSTISHTLENAMNLTGHPANIDECIIVENQGNGIWLGTTIIGSEYTISNTVIEHNGIDGISVTNPGDRVTITNCTVRFNQGDGLNLYGPSYSELVIAGCDISGNGNYGIKMDQVLDAEIYENYIGNCGQRKDSAGNGNTAINATNVYAQLNVSENFIGSNNGDGIYAGDIFQTFVANNTIGCLLDDEIMGNFGMGVHTSANYMQTIEQNVIQGHYNGSGIKIIKKSGIPLGSISKNSISQNQDGIEIIYEKTLPTPVLSSAISATANTTVKGTIYPVGPGIILEFFCNDEKDPFEGHTFIGTITTHKQSYVAVLPVTSCFSITATATKITNDGTWICSPFSKYIVNDVSGGDGELIEQIIN